MSMTGAWRAGPNTQACTARPPGQGEAVDRGRKGVDGGPAVIVLPLPALDLVVRLAAGPAGDAGGRVDLSLSSALEPGAASALEAAARGHGVAGERAGGANTLDPVIARLAAALDAAERDGGAYAEICREALQLAIAARLAGLRSAPPPARAAGAGLLPWRLKKVRDFVDAHLEEPITLADLAQASGLSRMYFAAQFRAATGLRPHDFVLRRRIDRACELLVSTDMAISQVASAVGFQTQAHFTTVFKRFVDDTPFRWRKLHTRRN